MGMHISIGRFNLTWPKDPIWEELSQSEFDWIRYHGDEEFVNILSDHADFDDYQTSICAMRPNNFDTLIAAMQNEPACVKRHFDIVERLAKDETLWVVRM